MLHSFGVSRRALFAGYAKNYDATLEAKLPQSNIPYIWDETTEKTNSTISGGKGNDILMGGSGKNIIDGGEGRNIIYGGGDTDKLIAGGEQSLLYGGTGQDIFSVASGAFVQDGTSEDYTTWGGIRPHWWGASIMERITMGLLWRVQRCGCWFSRYYGKRICSTWNDY